MKSELLVWNFVPFHICLWLLLNFGKNIVKKKLDSFTHKLLLFHSIIINIYDKSQQIWGLFTFLADLASCVAHNAFTILNPSSASKGTIIVLPHYHFTEALYRKTIFQPTLFDLTPFKNMYVDAKKTMWQSSRLFTKKDSELLSY